MKRILPLLLLLAGCQPAHLAAPSAATAHGTVAAPELPPQQPVPAFTPPRTRRLIDSGGNGTLTGTVGFALVTNPFFADSAASFHLLAMPAAHALITLTTLDEDVYTRTGTPITATADATGAFSLTGAPTDKAFVVCAQLAGDHRLCALVPKGATRTTLDETTTAVTEELRWQTGSVPDADTLARLTANTARTLAAADVAAAGTVPAIATLKSGAGLELRNAYVRGFASAVSKAGTSVADTLSDAWHDLLGYRPLAVVRAAGLDPATVHADDAVLDADGNMFVAPHDNVLLYVPARDRGPLPGSSVSLKGGSLYAYGGEANGAIASLAAYNQLYQPIERAAVTTPDNAPLAADGAPLWLPSRICLETNPGGTVPHVFLASRQGHRIYMIPATDLFRFGRSLKAGRLYTIAGYGAVEAQGAQVQSSPALYAYNLGDGGPAYQAPLAYPTGVCEDSRHNLYVADTGTYSQQLPTADPNATVTGADGLATYHQSIRLIRAADGQIQTFHLLKDGQPYPLSGAHDLRVLESAAGNYVYVADSLRHCVIRFRLPDSLATLDTSVAAANVEVVLGTPGQAGQPAPTLAGIAAGGPSQGLLLDTPVGLEVTGSGDLLVADAGHVRMLKGGQVYTLAGALDTGHAQGDANLVAVHPNYLTLQPGTGDLAFADGRSGAVSRLVAARGLR